MKPIPISAAREISKKYGYEQVIIYARKTGNEINNHGEHMTTYGINKIHCDIAARSGNVLKEFMGWNTKEN